jgi:hypothetical protein
MNANLKAPNNTAPQVNIGSFVAAPVNAMKNAANNVANSVKNMFNNVSTNDITEPIMESVNASIGNNSVPIVSVPIIITLGVLIILFIIVVMFRQQISAGLEMLWQKFRELTGMTKPTVQPPPPEFVPEAQFFQQGAVEKILPGKKEVFNIAQNKYSYTDAEPLCKAFGAELATYDQVKQAWQNGADWCNYGWVKGQSAVFPTQETTFNKLQAGPEDQRMSCGVPGINGGFFDNPELKFGVNCYGTKPLENEADTRAIMAQNGDLTPEALAYDKKVLDYKAHRGEIPVNPFKPGTWAN